MSIEISVIIPTFKRSKLLKRCIYALINQSFETKQYEIIVVTDGPDSETEKMIKAILSKYEDCVDIYCKSLPRKKGPAAARNAGWQIAKGKLIVFTDDDCIPLFSCLENYWYAYLNYKKEEIAFTGKIKVPLDGKITDFALNTALLERADFATANCACTKKALEKVNGFDEDFTMAWREDSALEFDLLENNIPILNVHNSIVVHPVRAVGWGISLKEQKKSMFNALLYKKHSVLFKQRMNFGPPWYYYVIVLLFLATVFGYFSLTISITIGLFLGWAIFISWFVLKRLRGTSLSISHVAEMIITSIMIPFFSIFWTFYGAIRFKTFYK